MNEWNQRKKRLIRERGELCEYCEKRTAADLDHAIYPKSVGKRIDDDQNLILLCKQCHANKPKHYRNWAYLHNWKRYDMNKWVGGLDLKVKDLG
jgi:5-methylcytosine-specific restriction endonuclease McrA